MPRQLVAFSGRMAHVSACNIKNPFGHPLQFGLAFDHHNRQFGSEAEIFEMVRITSILAALLWNLTESNLGESP